MHVPQTLANTLISLYGAKGQAWLTQLPATIAMLAKKWGLSELNPLPNLTYNYVLSGLKDNIPIILKLSIASDELLQEAALLSTFAKYGAIAVLAQAPGTLLLERATPGITLKNYFPLQETASIQIAIAVMNKLHQAPAPDPTAYRTVTSWLAAINPDVKIPKTYLMKALTLKEQLLSSTTKKILLHGDLHHDNILAHNGAWVVIDPKGVIGEPAYEVAAFIRNPIPELLQHPNAPLLIQNRILAFAQALSLSTERIYHWCFVQSVLAWIWNLEDNLDTTYFAQYTRLLDTLPP